MHIKKQKKKSEIVIILKAESGLHCTRIRIETVYMQTYQTIIHVQHAERDSIYCKKVVKLLDQTTDDKQSTYMVHNVYIVWCMPLKMHHDLCANKNQCKYKFCFRCVRNVLCIYRICFICPTFFFFFY